MPKKNWTPEERKAFGEKMRQKRFDKQAREVPTGGAVGHYGPEEIVINEGKDGPSEEDYQALLARVKELEKTKAIPVAASPQVSQGGTLIGSYERYVVDPKYYPDPRERLSQEPRLARLAFPLNYELTWTVESIGYENIDKVRMHEPRFTLELLGIILDEETAEPTPKRYIMRRLLLHEDPQAAIVVARDNGIEVDESNQRQFLDEMRYLRMRDWLFDFFFPKPSDVVKRNKRDEIIAGKLVETFEITSENSEVMPFGQLNKKL